MDSALFVGRTQELARLEDALAQALAGRGQVRFVAGEAGSGKTALAVELARRGEVAHPDLLAVMGNCNAQVGSGDPYLPFREALRPLLGDAEATPGGAAVTTESASRLQGALRWSWQALLLFGPDLVEILVPGAGLATKAVAFVADQGNLLERLAKLKARRASQPASERAIASAATGLDQSHILEQFTHLLQAVARRQPLLMILDDLQWADAASIGLLFHLGRRLDESRILILGAYRPDEVALGRDGQRHPLEKALAELKRYQGDVSVDLDRTVVAEGRGFVDAYLDAGPNSLDEAFREALYRRTGGHPLFVVELLQAMRERGALSQDATGHWAATPALDWNTLPARVEGVIEERVGRLASELRDLLTVASVEGADFTAEVVARVQAIDERRLVQRLSAELDRQHRLVEAQGRQRINRQRLSSYRFRHDLFHRYLYGALDQVEREYLHEDVGAVLEELYGEQTAEIAPQLARHFLQAGDRERALPYVIQAGRRARLTYANTEALHYLRLALELAEEAGGDLAAEKTTLYEDLGDVLVNVGQCDEGLAAYAAGLALLAERQMDGERAAVLHRKTAMAHERRGEYPLALHGLDQARQALAADAGSEMARVCLGMAGVLYRQGQATAALDWCQRGLALALEAECADVAAHGYLLRGVLHGAAGRPDLAIADGLQSLQASEESGDLLLTAKAHNNLGFQYHYKADWPQATTHYRASLELRERIGDVNGMATVSNNLGELYLLQGQFDEAFDMAARRWTRRTNMPAALSHGAAAVIAGQGDIFQLLLYGGLLPGYSRSSRTFRYVTDPPGPAACTVTRTADSGAGTLRACLQSATRGDQIVFDASAFPRARPARIAVTSGPLPELAAGGVTVDACSALDAHQLPAALPEAQRQQQRLAGRADHQPPPDAVCAPAQPAGEEPDRRELHQP